MKGLICLPLVPLRQNDSDRSEMTSQLLFGERVEILETREKWILVRNIADNYTGWADRKMIQIIDNKDNSDNGTELYCISYPLVTCHTKDNSETLLLPGGSKINRLQGNKAIIAGKTFYIDPIDIIMTDEISGERLISLAKQYLNAPYLWGGKSIMGIDCSGFVQVIYDMCGIQLPRDASQQVECGKLINNISELQAGDLAFFKNQDGKIMHVGMMINKHQIIHASGCVKIERLDEKGIISNQTGEYSHSLSILKRII